MKLWSKGLGTKSVTMSLKDALVENAGSELLVKGKMGAPVFWDYTITMTEQDLVDILHIASRTDTVSYMLGCKSRRRVYSSAVKHASKVALKTVGGLFKGSGKRSTGPDVPSEAG
jgi:hypothetical protein